MPSRRTHIVRVKAPDEGVPAGQDHPYVDIEVIDAIAYKTTNGHVHVWNCPSSGASPYIRDETGEKPDWSTGSATSTRGSHAKAISSDPDDPSNSLAFCIEVLDRIGFQDEQGKIWALDNPDNPSGSGKGADAFCKNDPETKGNAKSTRRTHLEEIGFSSTSGGTGGVPGKWQPPDKKIGMITVERVDIISFTGADEKKLIVNMESHDDGKRADTHCTPAGYDPSKPFGGVTVPTLKESKDPNSYFKFLVRTSPPQVIFSPSGFAWTATIKNINGNPNAGETFFSTIVVATAALALEDFFNFEAAFEAANGAGSFFLEAPSVIFVKGHQISTIPGGEFVPGIATGGIGGAPNGKDTVKIAMGPLWWIRAVYNGGGEAGSYPGDTS